MFFLLLLFLPAIIRAQVAIIDTPTADVIEYGYIGLNFRFYKDGIVNYITAGVYRRLNLGCSIDIRYLIGKDSIRLHRPAFRGQWRFFDGARYFPVAVAIGYDEQGYKYSEAEKRYTEPAKEFYLVGTSKLINQFLEISLGFNYNSVFERTFMSFSFSTLIKDIVKLSVEFDDIIIGEDWQLNSGIGIHFSEQVVASFIFKDLTTTPERTIQINWVKKI